MAICAAKTESGPCPAEALANGRCRRHGGLSTGPATDKGRKSFAESKRKETAARHAALRADGKPMRFYEATEETSQAQAVWAGKSLSEEHKVRISDGMKAAHASKAKVRQVIEFGFRLGIQNYREALIAYDDPAALLIQRKADV